MRIILGKSSGSANNGSNTTDFGGSVDNNATSVPTTSSSNSGASNYSTHSTAVSTSQLSNTCYPKTTNRKRKNVSPGDLFDCNNPEILLHQKQRSKLAFGGKMVSSTTNTKFRPNTGAPSTETTAAAAATTTTSGTGSTIIGPSNVPQGASRKSPRAEDNFQQLEISHTSISVADENEPPSDAAYDPNNPAAEDYYYEGEEEVAPEDIPCTPTSGLNISQSKAASSSVPQSKNLHQQFSPPSSFSDSRNISKTHTKELPSTVRLRRDKEFSSLMKKQLKFDIVEIDGDGNCLFRAVALQVFGDASMHNEVRRRCLEFMGKNEEHYSQFLTDEEPFHEYIQRKSMDGVHGNHVEIQAISELYNRPVEVYTPENGVKPINIFHSEYKTSDHPIRLSYHDGNHYNAVIDPFCPTAGLGLGLPGLKPGLADEMQLKEALIDSDRLDLDRLYVEKAIRDSEEFYKEKALALSDLEQTDFELEQAIIESSLETSRNIKQPRRAARELPSNRIGTSVRNRISPYADDLYSENSTNMESASYDFHRSSAVAASGSSNKTNPPGITSPTYIDRTFDNPAAHDGVISAINAEALAASEYPDSITELVMNGFELTHVLRAYELVGENFDDLLAFLINNG